MNNKNTDFPQYRKLFNDKSFFKILDNRNFIEIQKVGTKYVKYIFCATQYFEILKVNEMLEDNNPLYVTIEEEDYTNAELQISL